MEKQNQKGRGNMKILICLVMCLVMVGCAQTMTMVHTQGKADDVVDDTSTVSPHVSPVISIPAATLL